MWSTPFPIEAGLGECARYPAALGCEGLESSLAVLVLGIPGALVWVVLAGCAAASVARARPTHRLWWFAAVWCVPIVGALVWFAVRIFFSVPRRRRRWSPESKSTTAEVLRR